MKNTTKKNIKYVDKFNKKKNIKIKKYNKDEKKILFNINLYFLVYISQNESWQRLSKIISIS